MTPSVGRNVPAIIFNNVLLPAPVGPTIPTLDLGFSSKVIHRKIGPFANSWGIGFDLGIQFQRNDWLFGFLMKDLTTTINFWNINQDSFSNQFEETGNVIPNDDIEITYPQIFCGVAREFNLYKDSKVEIALSNLYGAVLAQKRMELKAELNSIQLKDLYTSLKAGVYFIKITQDGVSATKKVVISE